MSHLLNTPKQDIKLDVMNCHIVCLICCLRMVLARERITSKHLMHEYNNLEGIHGNIIES